MKPVVREVATPHGPARLHTRRSRRPIAALVLSHGAGNGVESPDLHALANALPRHDISTVLVEQPWRVAGRRIATPPATLDEGLRAATDVMRLRVPMVLGGRSAGARSAARMARALGARGCLAISFPLHPPGRPEKSRLPELLGSRVPTLVVQGERDAMGRPEEFPERVELAVVPGADHQMVVPRRGPVTQEEAHEVLIEAVLEWIVREVGGR